METILAISSFVLAVISVITVIVSIRQNNRMLEASTRPNITVYFDYSQMGEPIGYFVIKNFGNSSGKITSLTYNEIVKMQPTNLCDVTNVLNGMIGNSVAPSQKFMIPIKLSESPDGISTFDITYLDSSKNKKPYTEHIEINIKQYGKLSKSRIAYKDDKALSYPLQEIAERLM